MSGLCRPVSSVHTFNYSFLGLSLATGASSGWNRKRPSPNHCRKELCKSLKTCVRDQRLPMNDASPKVELFHIFFCVLSHWFQMGEKDPLITVGQCLRRCQWNLMKPQPHSPDEADQKLLSVKGKVWLCGKGAYSLWSWQHWYSFSTTQRVFINVLHQSSCVETAELDQSLLWCSRSKWLDLRRKTAKTHWWKKVKLGQHSGDILKVSLTLNDVNGYKVMSSSSNFQNVKALL